jgi:hypothetical protein
VLDDGEMKKRVWCERMWCARGTLKRCVGRYETVKGLIATRVRVDWKFAKRLLSRHSLSVEVPCREHRDDEGLKLVVLLEVDDRCHRVSRSSSEGVFCTATSYALDG